MDITYTFMIPVIQALSKYLHSYGWAIIGLTLGIRLLVWPLVVASTRSMQRMSQLQPVMKKMQERYKDDPAQFQKKMTEFYQKNKVNPLGGCLPMLIQLPVLFALFAAFTGPPFQDKAIPVKVKLLSQKQRDEQKASISISPASGANSPYVSPDGQVAKLVIKPGDSTLVFGENAEGAKTGEKNTLAFEVRAVDGELPYDFKPKWKVVNDPNLARINEGGQAHFPAAGDVTVSALVEGADKPISVNVHVVENGTGSGNIFGGGGEKTLKKLSDQTVQVNLHGQSFTVAVAPGEVTVEKGRSVDFHIEGVAGNLPVQPRVVWSIANDPNGSSISEDGLAVFGSPGEVTVEAVVPGIAKREPFFFISSIGKVCKGMELLQPQNFDVTVLILLFGISMWISQKFMVTQPAADADSEQAAVQKQTQQIMPIMLTGMFFFIPLPAGVYLYMVVSNLVQTLQTWLIMRSPVPDLVDVTDDGDNGNGKQMANSKAVTIEAESQNNEEELTSGKKKDRKKK